MRLRVTLAAVILLLALPAGAQTPELPPGFRDVLILESNEIITDMAFAPDGRVFLTVKAGEIFILKDEALIETRLLTLPVDVRSERGLLAITLHPEFAENGYFYVYYSAGPGSLDYPGRTVGRLSRFQISDWDPDVADPASELILIDLPTATFAHEGGGLRIGLDRKLYLSVGDDFGWTTARELDKLVGKVLRLNLDGTIPDDNPFVGVDGVRPEIWAYGFRNPWRLTIHPHTGDLFIGDVGHEAWEEINIGIPGGDFGWPIVEGPEPPGVPGVIYPIYAYAHDERRAAVMGGPIYDGDMFPPEYRGNYFFGEFNLRTIYRMVLSDSLEVLSVEPFALTGTPPAGNIIITLDLHPDGSLWYSTMFAGEGRHLRKIIYDDSGAVYPSAVSSASVTSGLLPLVVSFSSEGSSNPDGGALSYLWDFGDGNSSTEPTPVHTFAAEGIFRVLLTVTNAEGNSAPAVPLYIHAGNQAPDVFITSPTAGATYRAGDTIQYAGEASDLEDGPLPLAALEWTVIFHHHEHTHPFLGPLQGVEQGSFTVPVRGETDADTWFRIRLRATDSGGLSATRQVEVFPLKSHVTLETAPSGLQVTLDGAARTAPFTFQGVVGLHRDLDIPAGPQHAHGKTYTFDRWQDEDESARTIVTPEADTTYTALFATVPADLAITIAGPDSALAGDAVTYAVTVTNHGPGSVPGATVEFAVPEHFQFSSAGDHECSAQSPVTCALGILPEGQSLNLLVTYVPAEGGPATVAVSVSSEVPDPEAANNTASALTTITPVADVAIIDVQASASVLLAHPAEYVLTLRNHGPSTATGVRFAAAWDGPMDPVVMESSAGSCGPGPECDLGTIVPAAQVTVHISARALSAGLARASFSLAADEQDPDAANNLGAAETEILPAADLQVSTSAPTDPVVLGDAVTYTVAVTNNGPSPATNVSLAEALPPAVTAVSATPSAGSCMLAAAIECTLGELEVGATATVEVVVTPTAAGALTTTTVAQAAEEDHLPESATTSAVIAVADLHLTLPAALTVARTQATSVVLQVQPQGAAFNQAITFTCAAAPTPLTCTFSPAEVTPGAEQVAVTVTISRPASAWLQPPQMNPWHALWLPFAAMVLAAAAGRRGRARRRRCATALMFLLVVFLWTACGGAPAAPPPPPPASTTLTITAKSASWEKTATAAVTLP